jgi:chorismate mutase
MTDRSLEELRKIIDDIDSQMVGLLNERARTALEVGKVKADAGKGAYDPGREKTVLDTIDRLNEGPLSKGALEEIYAAIMTACRELQIQKSS